jgi:hypothetical protein
MTDCTGEVLKATSRINARPTDQPETQWGPKGRTAVRPYAWPILASSLTHLVEIR